MRRQAEKLTRGVDDVDALVLPKAGGGRRSDGDAPLLLLRHPVHGRAALVHLADLVGLAGIEKDALGGGGLAGVNVRHDSNVAVVRQLSFPALTRISVSVCCTSARHHQGPERSHNS